MNGFTTEFTTNIRNKLDVIGTPIPYNQYGSQHAMKTTEIMNSSNTFLQAVVSVAFGVLVGTTEADVVTVEVPGALR